MSEKKTSGKPISMRLFSSWEVSDRTPANCIPRLCSLTLIRLMVTRPLPIAEVSSVIIAVKMAGSRRTLRSNEIPLLDSTGLVNTELELHFSLQYPHFLKRDENRLVISLQRRKKYKNRTILGYKTLAEGTIDMALVLQRSVDIELGLFAPDSGNKENTGPIAIVSLVSLASQPVDDLDDRKAKASGLRRQMSSPTTELTSNPGPNTGALHGKGPHGGAHGDFSEDEDDFSSHSSDSPPCDRDVILRKNSKSTPHNRNLKQKIVNLLKKFKATEEGRSIGGGGPVKAIDGPVADHLDDLFDELDGLSDSEPDADTLSVGSFPKPVLPPFFASSKSLLQQNSLHEKSPINPNLTSNDERNDSHSHSHSDSWTEGDQQSESPKIATRSPGTSPSVIPSSGLSCTPLSIGVIGSALKLRLGSITDQIAKVCSDDGFPDLVMLVSLEGPGPGILSALSDRGVKVLGIESENDLKIVLPHIVGKVQKFCNNNAKPPPPLTIVVVGNEALLSGVTKQYVTQLSTRPHDWQSYFSFLFAPFSTGSSIWRLLYHSDSHYGQNFNDFTERGEEREIATRIYSYAKLAIERRLIISLPIAEAMITYKENDESSQVFVPFISEVRLNVGYSNPLGASIDQQHEFLQHQTSLSTTTHDLSSSPPSPPPHTKGDPLELQIDYWKGTVKSSVKAFFRTLTITRTPDNALTVAYVLKEQKKQKIMRLGKKKEREMENKNQSLEGISRLVCLAKSQAPIKLFVDGVERDGVKFFQVSSQWQSQVKTLPLLVSGPSKGSDV